MDAIFQCIPIIGKFEKGNICPFFVIMLLQKYYSIPLDAVLEKSKRYTKASFSNSITYAFRLKK